MSSLSPQEIRVKGPNSAQYIIECSANPVSFRAQLRRASSQFRNVSFKSEFRRLSYPHRCGRIRGDGGGREPPRRRLRA